MSLDSDEASGYLSMLDAVLKRPSIYAEDWRTFCYFVWGIWHGTERNAPRVDWINFLKFILVRLGYPVDWPNNYTRPERTLELLRKQYSSDEEAFRAISALYREYRQSQGQSIAMLLVFSGLPGTGKSTLAREVVRQLGAVYLRVDSLEAALLNAGQQRVTVEGYAAAYAMAVDNLSLGLSVVADCVNHVQETREAWAEVALRVGVRLMNIEVICSDRAEHRRRVEARAADPSAQVGGDHLPAWEEVERWPYQPWPEAIHRVDTAEGTPTDLASKLLASLKDS